MTLLGGLLTEFVLWKHQFFLFIIYIPLIYETEFCLMNATTDMQWRTYIDSAISPLCCNLIQKSRINLTYQAYVMPSYARDLIVIAVMSASQTQSELRYLHATVVKFLWCLNNLNIFSLCLSSFKCLLKP